VFKLLKAKLCQRLAKLETEKESSSGYAADSYALSVVGPIWQEPTTNVTASTGIVGPCVVMVETFPARQWATCARAGEFVTNVPSRLFNKESFFTRPFRKMFHLWD
jgi:hypothetical protein